MKITVFKDNSNKMQAKVTQISKIIVTIIIVLSSSSSFTSYEILTTAFKAMNKLKRIYF